MFESEEFIPIGEEKGFFRQENILRNAISSLSGFYVDTFAMTIGERE
jgi:hypothetical protein